MSWLAHEWRLLWRSRLAVTALALLFVLSALSVYCGLREIHRQQQTIAKLTALQSQSMNEQMQKHAAKGNAGDVAYYTFLGTYDAPAPAAFMALGLRDTAPYALRIRALALQTQLHEGEHFNPELALAGRFDFSFLLVYLSPLVLIALLYDLVSGERAAGRLTLLQALPGAGRRLWLRRAALRAGLVLACLALPVLIGAGWQGMGVLAIAPTLAATAAYVGFWCGLSLWVAARGASSVSNATILMGCWTVLTLVLPSLANVALTQAVPVRQGVELTLAQRQVVHGAWDQPREETLQRFFKTHQQWRNTAALPPGFHWKWYLAFQQLGDESVAPQAAAYRDGLLARQRWTQRLGLVLPGVGVQTVLHRQAGTDLLAQLRFQDDVAAFHARLRSFLYPYVFNDAHFGASDFAKLPRFEPAPRTPSFLAFADSLGAMLIAGVLALALGIGATQGLLRSRA